MPSTHPHLPRLSFHFDFDKTLAGDSLDALFSVIDLDRDEYENDFVEPLGDEWDPILRRGHALIEACRAAGRPLTRSLLTEGAEANTLYDGVLDLPERLLEAAREVHDDIEVGVHILSAGFEELILPTDIARRADSVSAGAFHFDGDKAVAVKRTITHPEKALYLRAHAEGRDIHETNAPGASTGEVGDYDMHVMFDQMVFVGDGLSDLQAFGFLERMGGMTLAIDKTRDFDHADAQSEDQRVENLAPPDYSEGSELLESLLLAARAGASRVAIRARGENE